MWDGADRPWYVTAVYVDETERVAAQDALVASEARGRALLTHAAGLAPRLDRWVLDRALRDLAGLRRDGKDVRVAVNLSAHTLADPTIEQAVVTAEQADVLRGLGCQFAQGWLRSPAVPVISVAGTLRLG